MIHGIVAHDKNRLIGKDDKYILDYLNRCDFEVVEEMEYAIYN